MSISISRIQYIVLFILFTSCSFYEKGSIEHLNYYESNYKKIFVYMSNHKISDSYRKSTRELATLTHNAEVNRSNIDIKNGYISYIIEDGFNSYKTYKYYFAKNYIAPDEYRNSKLQVVKVKDRWYFTSSIRFGKVSP